MDHPQPNPLVAERVAELVTAEFLERLTHYALRKIGQKWWRGVWNGKIPGGVQAGDLAVSAIEAVLIGDPKRGGRTWDPIAEPDLMKILRSVVDSKVSHLIERAENIREREPTPAEGESVSDYLDRKVDRGSLPTERPSGAAVDEAANEKLFFALLEETKDDPLIPGILGCELDGIVVRAEIAKMLGVDPNAITQATKRLERLLPKFGEKYSHMNPWSNL